MENKPLDVESTIINGTSILKKLYESNGTDKQSWIELLLSINKSQSFLGIISFLRQKMEKEPSNPLTLDIIDFCVDYGPIEFVREISKVEFMSNVFNLLKESGDNLEVPKKGIYLTKKWNEKANEYPNENFPGFVNNYVELNNLGISFPSSDFVLYTYEQFISKMEISENVNSMQNQNFMNNYNANENQQNNNFNNNFNNQQNINFNNDTDYQQNNNFNNNIKLQF